MLIYCLIRHRQKLDESCLNEALLPSSVPAQLQLDWLALFSTYTKEAAASPSYKHNWPRNRTYLVVPPLDYVLSRPIFALMDQYIS